MILFRSAVCKTLKRINTFGVYDVLAHPNAVFFMALGSSSSRSVVSAVKEYYTARKVGKTRGRRRGEVVYRFELQRIFVFAFAVDFGFGDTDTFNEGDIRERGGRSGMRTRPIPPNVLLVTVQVSKEPSRGHETSVQLAIGPRKSPAIANGIGTTKAREMS